MIIIILCIIYAIITLYSYIIKKLKNMIDVKSIIKNIFTNNDENNKINNEKENENEKEKENENEKEKEKEKENENESKNKILTLIKEIDNMIDDDLSSIDDNNLKEMCKYATSGGKRIRSILMILLNKDEENDNENDVNIFNDKLKEKLKDSILFIEYLHASSLIMDDIMDFDKERRGKICSHIKYGQSKSLITSTYLFSLALIHLSSLQLNTSISNFKKEKIINSVSENFKNLCVGQYYDISNESHDIDDLMEKKTSTLFMMSYVLAWVNKEKINNVNENVNEEDEYNKYVEMGKTMGNIFQLADDFEDINKDLKVNNGKNNYVCTNGIIKSYKKFNELSNSYEELEYNTNSNYNTSDIILKLLEDKVNKAHESSNISSKTSKECELEESKCNIFSIYSYNNIIKYILKIIKSILCIINGLFLVELIYNI
jgi:farnesyl diphosphate synthase